MPLRHRLRPTVPVLLGLGMALGGCGNDSSATPTFSASSMVSPLTAFDCATDDPTGVGELTGAWAGSGGGTYYIRQVGDCVWWFGTELRNVVPGATGQPGFANAAVGRLDGPHLELEYVDLPLGDVLGGGGLSWIYVDGNELLLTDQRRNWQPIWRYRANAYRGAAESECDVAVT